MSEPDAWIWVNEYGETVTCGERPDKGTNIRPLHAAPPEAASRIAALEAAIRGVLKWRERYGNIRDNDRSREAIAALDAALAPAPGPAAADDGFRRGIEAAAKCAETWRRDYVLGAYGDECQHRALTACAEEIRALAPAPAPGIDLDPRAEAAIDRFLAPAPAPEGNPVLDMVMAKVAELYVKPPAPAPEGE